MKNMSIVLFIVHYKQVHSLNCLINYEAQKEDLINIKNNDNKCFLWCHMRYLNPLKIPTEKITKAGKKNG